MAKSKDRIDVSSQRTPLTQGLSGLAALRAQLPAGAAPTTPSATAEHVAAPNLYACAAKLVLRRERKGHGGKTLTRIEGLQCSAAELDTALREIKRSLGCGATIEGSDILVQGDQTDRLRTFLVSQGAKKIIIGN